MKNDPKDLLAQIGQLASQIRKPINIMEVCGTHTQAISRFGIREMLPPNLNLITGPGCPVCVTPDKDIASIVGLAKSGVPVATYGDCLRLKSFNGCLDDARAQGAKVHTIYSLEEALELRQSEPDLVFFAYGFETTAPMTAYAIKSGLRVFSAHKFFIPAMHALLESKEINIDGFLSPGHVSAITGLAPYEKMEVSQVITGFEKEDILVGILLLLKLIHGGKKKPVNEYLRLVKKEGNMRAQNMIREVFEPEDCEWKGFGVIPSSGMGIRSGFKAQNAKEVYKSELEEILKDYKPLNNGCLCHQVVLGIITPHKCGLFKKVCTPNNPQGACMVSQEGACNVAFKYGT